MYVHIDCNSYFASCEIATRPGLEGKPVVVANDDGNGTGVILALSAEAKALGLKRGIPLFKVRDKLKADGVVVCKADHYKYRSISENIMQCVLEQGIVQDFVQYSVDEFFGTLPVEEPAEVRRYVTMVKDLIWEQNHIPVGCGCSQTYTLAKVATHFAKHYRGYRGVCVLTPDKRERALSLLKVGDVWGVGRQNRRHLEGAGIVTALDLANTGQETVGRLLNTAGMRTWNELRGIPAVTLSNHERQKSISHSHSFPVMITDREGLASELRSFVSRCATTLRRQGSLCSMVTVFVNTNRYRDDLPQYNNGVSVRLAKPTADTTELLHTVGNLLDQIYRKGYQYKRAGVILGGIVSDEGHQLDLFTVEADERRRRLMEVADGINRRFGRNSVAFGI